MNTSKLLKRLGDNLSDGGFSFVISSIDHLEEIKRDLERPYKNGLIGHTFFHERLSHFEISSVRYKEKLASIFITAAPQSQQKTIFWYEGKDYHFMIPPTYSLQTDKKIEQIILNSIGPYDFNILPAIIPLKIAAVRTGLAKYGRNNITYSNEMGSYFRLKAFFSNFPVHEDRWYELELTPQCENCNACIQSCPTQAIRDDRILLQSDRCLTYYNERTGEFPPWIEKSWHNCLIGCMRCQIVCPMNKNVNIQPEKAMEFSEEETRTLLCAVNENDLHDSITSKLNKLSLFEDWPLLARNLRVMLTF